MSVHVFANLVTPFGTAANNRAETEGNITTLQKIFWQGQSRSTVSAEAIRFAVRRLLAHVEPMGTNRTWNEDLRRNEWRSGREVDAEFAKWANPKYAGFIDDDLLGFMAAEAGKEEAEETDSDVTDTAPRKDKLGKPTKAKGTATTRRSPLEVTRAISLTPWVGDVTFNAASPMATPSAAKKGTENPVPYGTEVHATRYQYGIALTPDRLRDKSRAAKAIDALCALGTVAGNHGRFLFDFSPDSVVIRLTDDPAPRLLYCFETADDGKTVDAPVLLERVTAGDIDPKELILGGTFLNSPAGQKLKAVAGVTAFDGVRAAAAEAVKRINETLKIKG
jgi:CRISPR-associated protein Cst2